MNEGKLINGAALLERLMTERRQALEQSGLLVNDAEQASYSKGYRRGLSFAMAEIINAETETAQPEESTWLVEPDVYGIDPFDGSKIIVQKGGSTCERCREYFYAMRGWRYCPNCGRKMTKERTIRRNE